VQSGAEYLERRREKKSILSSTIFGYASMQVGELLKPFYYGPLELGEKDVRVSVIHCGICHTDIQAVNDYYGMTTYPFVPGQEIVGMCRKQAARYPA